MKAALTVAKSANWWAQRLVDWKDLLEDSRKVVKTVERKVVSKDDWMAQITADWKVVKLVYCLVVR